MNRSISLISVTPGLSRDVPSNVLQKGVWLSMYQRGCSGISLAERLKNAPLGRFEVSNGSRFQMPLLLNETSMRIPQSKIGLIIAGFYLFCAGYAYLDALGSCPGQITNYCADAILYLTGPGGWLLERIFHGVGIWWTLALGSIGTAAFLYLGVTSLSALIINPFKRGKNDGLRLW